MGTDIEEISVGQELMLNGRYEDLKRENGDDFGYVAKRDDIVVVKKNLGTKLLVCFFEDTVRLSTMNREIYGEFIIESQHIKKTS